MIWKFWRIFPQNISKFNQIYTIKKKIQNVPNLFVEKMTTLLGKKNTRACKGVTICLLGDIIVNCKIHFVWELHGNIFYFNYYMLFLLCYWSKCKQDYGIISSVSEIMKIELNFEKIIINF